MERAENPRSSPQKLRATDNRALLEASRGGTCGPAIAQACALDELAEDDEGGGEEELEVDDRLALLGAASDLAVAIHQLVRSFHDPSRAILNRGRDAFAS